MNQETAFLGDQCKNLKSNSIESCFVLYFKTSLFWQHKNIDEHKGMRGGGGVIVGFCFSFKAINRVGDDIFIAISWKLPRSSV